jgi:hypothetical protein
VVAAMIQPEFNKSVPAEVRLYGANAQLVLALVRFATALDGEHNGRLLIDGEMWWRGSHTEIGEATGLTVDQVRGAVHKLEAADAQPLLIRSFSDSEQSRAYRVPDQPVGDFASVLTSQSVISPDTPVKLPGTPVKFPTAVGEITDCTSTKELKELEEVVERADAVVCFSDRPVEWPQQFFTAALYAHDEPQPQPQPRSVA